MMSAPVTAPAGTVAVICVSLLTVKLAVTLLANLMAVTPVRLLPVMVTVVPACPARRTQVCDAGTGWRRDGDANAADDDLAHRTVVITFGASPPAL